MEDPHSAPAPPAHPYTWVPEFLQLLGRRSRFQAKLLLASILVGILAGLGAVLFSIACQLVVRYSLDGIAGYRAKGPAGEAHVQAIGESEQTFRPWLLPVTSVIGGLISGYLVFRFAPEAEGHGTDSVIAAYHFHHGAIRARVPLVKLLASAITIGTGGSGGREGPIAQIGAGFGSALGKYLRLRPSMRRVLLAAGMGAGVAAIFRAPLAGALFAAEVLYRSPEFEPEAIMPAGLASVVAYSTFGLFFGWRPLFSTPKWAFDNAWQLLPYTMLALAMAFLAMLYCRSFYWLTHQFHALRFPRVFKPALGAFLSAMVGLALYYTQGQQQDLLSVLSFGYGILQNGFERPEQLSLSVLLAVALGKIVTTGLTIGSGGSGGVFGPSMVIGGCGGGAIGLLFHRIWPAVVPHPGSFMIVGMTGFFAAAAKTPFSTLIIVCELTGDYLLILPALWVCTLSYLLSDEQSLYQSQVENRAHSPAHQGDYVRQVLAGRTVSQILSQAKTVPPIHLKDSLDQIIARFDANPWLVLPVVDGQHQFSGVIHIHELYWTANRREAVPWIVAADLMRVEIQPLRPEDSLQRAVELFVENDLPELPVVESGAERKLLGMVRRTDVTRAYLHRVHGLEPKLESPLG